MALFGTGDNTKYWRAPVSLPDLGGRPATPLWVSVWVKNTGSNPASNQGYASFGNTGNTACAGTYMDTSGQGYAWDRNDAGSFAQSTAWVDTAGSSWHHVLAYFSTASSRQFYALGVQVGTETSTTLSAQTLNMMQVARLSSATAASLATTRQVAEVVFGRRELSAGQITALATGRNPLTVLGPGQILAYFPLRGDLNDLGPARTGLTPIGGAVATFGDHPNVAMPRRRRLFKPTVVTVNRRPFITIAA